MKKVGEILANAVINLEASYDMKDALSKDVTDGMSIDELRNAYLSLACSYVGCLYGLSQVVDYIKFVRANETEVNHD